MPRAGALALRIMLLLLSGLSACRPVAPPVGAPSPHRLELRPLAAPSGPEGDQTRSTDGGTLDGVAFSLTFQALARTGDVLGGVEFGRLSSRSGAPLGLCEGLDATGLWRVGGGWELLTHFECLPGAVYRTPVAVSPDGQLHAASTARIDGAAIDGGEYFCAGAVTSWGTHLSAEEYEADARKRQPDGTVSDNFEDYNSLAAWWEGGFAASHPWDYGWVVEVAPDAPPARRWAMGRFSHEMALPMPDDRTVYLTDDSAKGGSLFLFRADKERDFSAGTLYAARWARQADGAHGLTWLSLGHASDAEVEAVAHGDRSFDAVFDATTPSAGVCPAGFGFAASSWGGECLRVRPGREAAASRLEARRAAALAGATTEVVKSEGMAVAPELHTLYVSLTRYEGPALAGAAVEGARDDLALDRNPCGGVWALALGRGPAGGPDGDWVATAARPLLEGTPEGSGCRLDGLANPDNLAWIAGAGTLAIAEDTERHPNAALWFYDVARQQLTRVLTAPPGAEVSGLRWTAGVEGHNFLSVAVQHPWEGVSGATADQLHSTAGVLGPFPDLEAP